MVKLNFLIGTLSQLKYLLLFRRVI